MARRITIACIFLFLYVFVDGATISTNKTIYTPGEIITVTFGAASAKTDWVGMYSSIITPGPQNSIAWLYLNGSKTIPVQIIESGTLNFTAPPVTGSYKLCFHPNGGYTVAATADFTVSTTGVSPGPNSATDVKFMHLNVWVSGTKVPNGLTYIRDVVASVDPDIVCFVEVDNSSGDWTTKMVNELAAIGHYYYSGYMKGSDASILSKYPITKSGPLLKSAVSLFDVDVNGNSMVVAAAHLDYTFYACYLPRGYNCGGSAPYTGWEQIGSPDPQPVTDLAIISAQNLGSQRDEQMGAFLDYEANEIRPIVLMGDFNEPSDADWTVGQANMFDHNGVVYPWNTTNLLNDQSYIDVFRQIYPDEVLNPGITWPSFATGAGSTSWTPKSDDRDRIDYIFYKGSGVKAINAAIIGPKGSYAKGLLTNDHTDNDHFIAETLPWPSDHKGVFATITIPTAIDSTTSNRLQGNGSSEIMVFPNPILGIFNLVTSESMVAHIKITSLTGKDFYDKEMKLVSNNLNALDVSYMPNGVYFLSVVTENSSQTFKIVKQ